MGRTELVSGNVWEQYSKKVQERMNNPIAMGEFTQKDAEDKNARLVVADFGAESCGDAVRLFWLVDEKTNRILDSKFKSFGCGTAIASSDAMAELCIGRTVDEAINITNTEVEQFLRDEPDIPAVPPQKMHCSVMAYDVILEAAAQYKGISRDSLVNQDIVCECARKTREDIIKAIKENNLETVEQIGLLNKAGTYCKSCVQPGGHEAMDVYLVDILKEVRNEIEKEKSNNPTDNFDKLTIVQKIRKIEECIEEKIRPSLQNDGGDLMVVDLKEENEEYIVYISYEGACSSCDSGKTGTLYAIDTTLKNFVSEKIQVVVC